MDLDRIVKDVMERNISGTFAEGQGPTYIIAHDTFELEYLSTHDTDWGYKHFEHKYNSYVSFIGYMIARAFGMDDEYKGIDSLLEPDRLYVFSPRKSIQHEIDFEMAHYSEGVKRELSRTEDYLAYSGKRNWIWRWWHRKGIQSQLDWKKKYEDALSYQYGVEPNMKRCIDYWASRLGQDFGVVYLASLTSPSGPLSDHRYFVKVGRLIDKKESMYWLLRMSKNKPALFLQVLQKLADNAPYISLQYRGLLDPKEVERVRPRLHNFQTIKRIEVIEE